METKTIQKKRNLYLIVGVLAMLFSGVLYAWSILKAPFKDVFGWSDSSLALNFTMTMCFFCLGAFANPRHFIINSAIHYVASCV